MSCGCKNKAAGNYRAASISDLSEQECTALIEILELRVRLCDIQQEAIYFLGCYDRVGYLKKAGIL